MELKSCRRLLSSYCNLQSLYGRLNCVQQVPTVTYAWRPPLTVERELSFIKNRKLRSDDRSLRRGPEIRVK
ncbi:hypothetical protein HanRHA438_Chr10g0445031 [Helianthus annuus]|nr:hypothetical protein HanRHA438_Chr10g0445031 [Helianthus annuus]